jgi:four helix bundle protein
VEASAENHGDSSPYPDRHISFDSDTVEAAENKLIQCHFELKVFQKAEKLSNEIFELTKAFPTQERYSLTSQIRNSSRSVAAAISEAWRRRRYPAAFINKLNEAEAEAAETQTWVRFANSAEYINKEVAGTLISQYDQVLSMLVSMQRNSEVWTKNVGYGNHPQSNS